MGETPSSTERTPRSFYLLGSKGKEGSLREVRTLGDSMFRIGKVTPSRVGRERETTGMGFGDINPRENRRP